MVPVRFKNLVTAVPQICIFTDQHFLSRIGEIFPLDKTIENFRVYSVNFFVHSWGCKGDYGLCVVPFR